jgi:hypothetical protein
MSSEVTTMLFHCDAPQPPPQPHNECDYPSAADSGELMRDSENEPSRQYRLRMPLELVNLAVDNY